MRYNQIVKCDLKPFYESKDENETYHDVYLLTYDGCSNELEIDLCGMMSFNTEFESINRKIVSSVDSFNDLLDFMKKNDISSLGLHYDDNYIYVGGCRDYILNKELDVLGWIEELEENNEIMSKDDKEI